MSDLFKITVGYGISCGFVAAFISFYFGWVVRFVKNLFLSGSSDRDLI